jgi:hypothetical protein
LGKNKEEDKPSFLQKNTGSGFYIKESSTAKNTFNPMMMNPQMQQAQNPGFNAQPQMPSFNTQA